MAEIESQDQDLLILNPDTVSLKSSVDGVPKDKFISKTSTIGNSRLTNLAEGKKERITN